MNTSSSVPLPPRSLDSRFFARRIFCHCRPPPLEEEEDDNDDEEEEAEGRRRGGRGGGGGEEVCGCGRLSLESVEDHLEVVVRVVLVAVVVVVLGFGGEGVVVAMSLRGPVVAVRLPLALALGRFGLAGGLRRSRGGGGCGRLADAQQSRVPAVPDPTTLQLPPCPAGSRADAAGGDARQTTGVELRGTYSKNPSECCSSRLHSPLCRAATGLDHNGTGCIHVHNDRSPS